jgi:Fe-S-cluster containining protein
MLQPQTNIPAAMAHKKEVLHAIYSVYSSWAEGLPLACQKGCASCCTQSVTMSSLEGEVIRDYAAARGREKWLLAKLAHAVPGRSRVTITMNQFAWACLNRRELDGDTSGTWDFRPCVFLEENICSIYAVRPFGCRSFGSLVQCTTGRAAEMAPIHLTVNTVFTQIIEHLSSDGGHWSTMADILHGLVNGGGRKAEIQRLPARPVPGFLLEKHEVPVVKNLLQQLRRHLSETGIFGDLIDNFMPI